METKTKTAPDNGKVIGAYNSTMRSPLSLALAIILTLCIAVGVAQIPLIITSKIWTNFIGFGITLPLYVTAVIAAIGLYKLRFGKGDTAKNLRAQKNLNLAMQIYEILTTICTIVICILMIIMCADALAHQSDKAAYLAEFKSALLNGGMSANMANLWYDIYYEIFNAPVANLVLAILATALSIFITVNVVITFSHIRKKYNRLAECYANGTFDPDDKYPIVRPIVFGVLTVASAIISFLIGGASGTATSILVGVYLVVNTFYFSRIHDGMLDRLG